MTVPAIAGVGGFETARGGHGRAGAGPSRPRKPCGAMMPSKIDVVHDKSTPKKKSLRPVKSGHEPVPGGRSKAEPAVAWGLTDPLDRFLPAWTPSVVRDVLDAIDDRASVRITADAIELHGLLGVRRILFDHIKGIELTTTGRVAGQVVPHWRRLATVLPIGRLARIATVATSSRGGKATVVDLDDLERPVLARLRRIGRPLELRGTPALVALTRPELVARLLLEADRHQIPVTALR